MNRGNIKSEVLVRLGKDTTSAWVNETILNDWVNQSYRWVTGYKPWPLTEARISTTYTTTEEWNFEGIKPDSIRILQVGGKRFKKLNFEDYQTYKEEQPDSTDKVFSDFNGTTFVTTNSGVTGTLTAYAQFMPAEMTDDSEETVFTPTAEEGNQAVIQEAMSYALRRDGRTKESFEHHQMAMNTMEILWKRIMDEQFKYQTHAASGGMWERFDVLHGEFDDDSSENQF